MDSIKVDKQELLDTLKANREIHIKDFLEAQAKYRREAIDEIAEMLKEAKKANLGKGHKIRRNITAVEPQSFEASYNTAIKMLEMSIDETIELSQQEFQQYVEDNWSWRGVFASTTMSYKSK